MPRPEQKEIQFTIDGREVRAAEGSMLVDAAKQGDVEIPFFCYEPKLGNPVGACRMCLVEIEGIPKLQTACSTPVKDGMVVDTQSERVRGAQQAVVEFLLVNHPLDCPVCDKGGECPLQDITFGWGAGRSRFIEPKRHFVKPLALSPLVAIDRERCILCYRCVRFSQEVAEDYQLIVAERITAPLIRDGGELREVSWERALEAAAGLARHRGKVGALVGGQATNEEGFLLQRMMREGLDSPHVDSRVCGPLELNLARAL